MGITPKTWDEACEHYQALVWKIALQFAFKYHMDADDLAQEGFLVLRKCVENFDASTGNKFITFAQPAIVRGITKYCKDNRQTIRSPVWNNITTNILELDKPMTEDGDTLQDIIPDESQRYKQLVEELEHKQHMVDKFVASLKPEYAKLFTDYLTGGSMRGTSNPSKVFKLLALFRKRNKITIARKPKRNKWNTLADFKVGQQQTFNCPERSARGCASNWGFRLSRKFSVRKVGEGQFVVTRLPDLPS